MVNGQMECLGSIQHLKNKYGDGYTISVILKSTDKRYSVQQFFEQNVQGCTLCDTRYRTLTYEVTVLQENLAHLFKVLENLFKSEDIEDYSVSQNTLDNVFINFSKQQKELAKDMEETNTDTNEDPNNIAETVHEHSSQTVYGVYDEPLILLTPRNDIRPSSSCDSDEEILIA